MIFKAIADQLISEWIDDGESGLAQSAMCCRYRFMSSQDQLGVPRSELALLRNGQMPPRQGWGAWLMNQQIQNAKDIVEFQHCFADLIDRMRDHPEDNIISDLANNTIDEGRLLTKPEALGMIQQILVAGNETSTNAIAGALCC